MADWIHCNKCFQKVSTEIKFFLKECGRIECGKCIKYTGEGLSNCVSCNKSCRTILLGSSMKPEIQNFFRPVPFLLDTVKKAYEFQSKQQSNILNYMQRKYANAKQEVIKGYKMIDIYKKENEKMRTALKGRHLTTPSAFFTSTPVQQSAGSPSCFDGSLSTLGLTPKRISAKPGYPFRLKSVEKKCPSTVSSLEHVVPGSRLSVTMVPTHHPQNTSLVTSLMSQMMQNDVHSKVRRQ
ncbi:hypothetical protein Trydic_g8773 [Trypoxylus dichotomus]